MERYGERFFASLGFAPWPETFLSSRARARV